MHLRGLIEQDAPLMLEWMHDPDIQKGFKKKMVSLTENDALKFIRDSAIVEPLKTGDNLHLAIADEEDRYLGTISLKSIDIENGTAEYAIITRKEAHGTGIAHRATGLILKKAFFEMGLRRVFLSVYSNNVAAIKLYEKSGFKYEGEFREHFLIENNPVGWKWYGILKEEFDESLFEESGFEAQ